jgi:hypothetical protein
MSTHSHKLANTTKEALTSSGNTAQILDLIKAGFLENLSKRDLVDFDPSIPFNVQPYYMQGKYLQLIKDVQKQM